MLRDLAEPFSRDQPYDIVMTAPVSAPDDDDGYARPDVGTVDILDDIFGSVPSSPNIQPVTDGLGSVEARNREQHPSDLPRLRSTHVTNGYREGIAASKEKYLQEGFDEGYSLGAELGLKAGWCLGVLEGLVKAVPTGNAKSENSVDEEERKKVVELLEQARQELKIEVLCGSDWFGEDGVWTYDVPGQDRAEEEGVSFAEVAAAHPILQDWVGKVGQAAVALGLRVPS